MLVLMTDVGIAMGKTVPVGDGPSLVNTLDRFISSQIERERILNNQKAALKFYDSRSDYMKFIKQSWQNCFL